MKSVLRFGPLVSLVGACAVHRRRQIGSVRHSACWEAVQWQGFLGLKQEGLLRCQRSPAGWGHWNRLSLGLAREIKVFKSSKQTAFSLMGALFEARGVQHLRERLLKAEEAENPVAVSSRAAGQHGASGLSIHHRFAPLRWRLASDPPRLPHHIGPTVQVNADVASCLSRLTSSITLTWQSRWAPNRGSRRPHWTAPVMLAPSRVTTLCVPSGRTGWVVPHGNPSTQTPMRPFPQVDHACEWQTIRGSKRLARSPSFIHRAKKRSGCHLEVLSPPRAQFIGLEQVSEKGWGRSGSDDLRSFWR